MPNSKNGDPRVINNINIIINVGQDVEEDSVVSQLSKLTTEAIELEHQTTAQVTTPAEKIADNDDENLLTDIFTIAEVSVQSSTSQVDVFTTTVKTDETVTQAVTDKTTFELFSSTEGVGAANTTSQAASTLSVSSTLIPSSEIDSEAKTSAITSIAPETSLPPPLGTTTRKEPENAIFEAEYSTTSEYTTIIDDIITEPNSGGKSSDESVEIPEIQIDFQEDTTKTPLQVQTTTEKQIVTSLNSVATPAWRLSTNTDSNTASINNIDERLKEVTNSTIGELNNTRASTIASLTSTAANSSKAAEEIVNKTELSTAPEGFQTELFTALPTTAEATESPSAKADATTEGERNALIDTTATTSFSLGKDFRITLV